MIVFDDINWSIGGSQAYKRDPELMARFSEDERACQSVRLVWDTLVPAWAIPGSRKSSAGWAVARKAEEAEAGTPPAAAPVRS